MKNDNRRDFFRKGVTGLSGVALATKTLPGSPADPGKPDDTPALPQRILGRTGIKLPVISMGTGDTNNPKLIQAVYRAGIRFFATSAYYGNGNNEIMLGEALKAFPRNSYLVATSVMPLGTDHAKGLLTDPAAGPKFIADIEKGLKRLKMEYADIIFLPFAAKRESVFFEPLLQAMEQLKKEGKAKWLGIATHSSCAEAIRAAADTKLYDLVMTAYNFKNEKQKELHEAIGYAKNAGVGIVAMKSAAGAFWDKERKQPINTHAALKWVLENKDIASIVSGMTGYEELEKNLALMKQPAMTDVEKKDLKLAGPETKAGLYCRQCRECLPQCPHQVDIPTLMRSYMYAYGYRNLHHAQQTWKDASVTSALCSNCSSCAVTCTQGFPIREKIMDIARLKNVPEEWIA